MNSEFYKDLAKKRINGIFKLTGTNPEEAWKRAFWSLSGIISVAMYDTEINAYDYGDLSCTLHNYLEDVYNRYSGKVHN